MRLAPYALIATLAGAGLTAVVGIAPPPPLHLRDGAPWQLAQPSGPRGSGLERSRLMVSTARIQDCDATVMVPAVEIAPGFVVVPASGGDARQVQLVRWNGERTEPTPVTGRVLLGRPSNGAMLLALSGAPTPNAVVTTLAPQGTRLWSLRATATHAPSAAPVNVLGSVSGRVHGLGTRFAMVEPASLTPATALIDEAGTLTGVVVDADAAGRPLAVTPGLAMAAPREPIRACG